ncbi:lipoprotein insertase outer membrane protein LolB [Acidovorax sp.]|uniref:lipoprotein insertase outer membrane protein LolB n=1 Tax=Acidovorax sp. TaxID=1872122 RepID=UPI00258360D6|nr:lipoprotein insertase outer membrane protein LolB [Acidovorax sp.]
MPHATPQGLQPQGATQRLPHWFASLLAVFVLLLAGCAHPPATPESPYRAPWTGRLALQVEETASQSFSASFELSGSAQQGQFVLFNPLGNTLARIQWNASHAEITTGQNTRESESLDALLQDVLGTDIPVAALFSWLEGTHVDAVGWQVDLSAISAGRLVAQRHTPTPQATLRIILTR